MRTLEMDPLRFVFGVHFHQPVGNFDHVFQQHLGDVYRPLVEHLAEHRFFPFALHMSGPLLEWLEAHDSAYLDRKSTRLNSSHGSISYAVFCLKKKKKQKIINISSKTNNINYKQQKKNQ